MTTRIRFFAVLLAVLAFVAAACGDDGGSDADGADGGGGEVDDTTTSSTTTEPGTTQPIPDAGEALVELALSVVEFGDAGFVEIVNQGSDAVDLDGIFLCQYPTYADLGTIVEGGSLAAGESVRVAADNWGGLDAASGEAALYNGNSFSDSDAILAYVQWGEGGHERAPVAVEAGLWPAADAFVTPDPAFPNIESGGDPADPANWS